MFWYGWNSWVVELLGGFVLAGVVYLNFPVVAIAMFVSVLLSAFYELVLDPNGWDWTDVGQRQAGIIIGLAVWPALFHVLGVL